MISLQNAWDKMMGIKTLTEPERVPISESVFRFAAEDITAKHDSPPFTQSRFDGYALGDPGDMPSTFRIISSNGITAGNGFTYSLTKGEAIPIMTGAPVPQGTQKIVPNEFCHVNHGRLEIGTYPDPNRMFLKKGADFKRGDLYLKRNEKITPVHIAFLALDGRESIKVFSRPSISVICSGDELEPPNKSVLKKGKIRNSHPELIKSLLIPYGNVCHNAHLPDSLEVMKSALKHTLNSDVHLVITTGGLGQGIKDLTRRSLREIGASPLFEGIQATPIGTFSCYRYNEKVIFALPGGMVGVILLVKLFIHPFVRMMQGWIPLPSPGPFIQAKLINDRRESLLRSKPSRKGVKFIKGYLWIENDVTWVTPLSQGDPLTKMNAFIVLDPTAQTERRQGSIPVFRLWNT